ncbi:MAG: class A beta-lactamase-related serine hydrolase [Alphaproteobacteria bacterium]|nr:class A beta-lactamase-related serine hydrolase [Alphaproteobacteria bacterium]
MSANRRLAGEYEERLGSVLAHALANDALNIPGFVALGRRGASVYGPRAFGLADVASGRPMTPDAMIRMYSMTKVLTSAVALMLYEKGLFKLNDPVGTYVPSFDRPWTVVREARESTGSEIAVRNMVTGRRTTVRYAPRPPRTSCGSST